MSTTSPSPERPLVRPQIQSPARRGSTAQRWRRFSRRLTLGALLVGLIAAGWYGFLNGVFEAEQPVAHQAAITSTIREVSAWGRLSPSSDVIPLAPPGSQFSGRVEQLLVKEGDEIKLGQTIAILDTFARREAGLAEARARLTQARARYAAVKAGAKVQDLDAQRAFIALCEAEMAEALEQLNRGQQLVGSRSISQEDLTARRVRHQKAQSTLEQARNQLASLATPRPEDVEAAYADVELANASLMLAQADFEQSVIKSPIDGRVLAVHARNGQKIGELGVVEIGSTQEMHAVAEVFEEDLAKVQHGQAARVIVPSVRLELPGRVIRINQIVARKSVFNNDPVEDVDARVVEVRIAIDPEHSSSVERLSNARVHVRIQVD